MRTTPITKNVTYIKYIARGMKPIEKNIIVIDEQGNEYEATYLKRAKGLVKNGRARFIDEHTICLACPPNDRLEDSIMSENKEQNVNVTEGKEFTAKEIFNQICLLQQELTSNSYHSLHRLTDSVEAICDEENEDKNEQISEVCSAFMAREATFTKLLELYQKMYDDIANKDIKEATLIKEAFSEHSTNVIKNDCMTPEEQCMAVNYITDKITECIKNVCNN